MTRAMDTNAENRDADDELLWSIKTVVLKTGLSPSSIYRYAARDLFPAQRRIGPNRVAWIASEVLAWVESRPRQHRLRRSGHASPDGVAHITRRSLQTLGWKG